MKKLTLLLIICAAAFASGRSVQVTSGSTISAFPPNSAPFTTIGNSTTPNRVQFRLDNYGSAPYTWSIDMFSMTEYAGNSNQGLITNTVGNPPVTDQLGGGVPFPGVNILQNDASVLVEFQRDVLGAKSPYGPAYIQTICGVQSQVCNTNYWPISIFATTVDWHTFPITLKPGYSMAFLRWFSTLDTPGTPIPLSGVTGDLEDWEFENSVVGSVHGTTFSGGSFTYVDTPIYPPTCLPIAEQTFAIGKPGTLTASCFPLDGGAAPTVLWTETTSQGVSFFSATSGTTLISGYTQFGPVEFNLRVTDSSSQVTDYPVLDGAVPTDARDIIITHDPMVDYLIGPQIRYGANPMRWMDTAQKQATDIQLTSLSTNYPRYWDTLSAGTVSVSPTSVCGVSSATAWSSGITYSYTQIVSNGGLYYRSNIDSNIGITPGTDDNKWNPLAGKCLTGVGTHFTTDLQIVAATLTAGINATQTTIPISDGSKFGNGTILIIASTSEHMVVTGGGNTNTLTVRRGGLFGFPAAAASSGDGVQIPPTPYLVIHANDGLGGSGNMNVMSSLDYVIDDTHAMLFIVWNYPAYGSTATTQVNVPWTGKPDIGGYGNQNSNTPGNYYDVVKSLKAFALRTGMRRYQTAYLYLAHAWWDQPFMDRGTNYNITNINLGTSFKLPGRAFALIGMELLANDVTGAEKTQMYAGLRLMWDYQSYQLGLAAQSAYGFFDQREVGLAQGHVAHCAMFDTDPTHKAQCIATLQVTLLDKTHPQSVWDYDLSPLGSFPVSHNYYASWQPLAAFPSDTGASVDLVSGQKTVVGHKTHFLSMEWTDCTGARFIGTSVSFSSGGVTNVGPDYKSWLSFLPSLTAMPLDNSTREAVDGYCIDSLQSDTGLTLHTNYAGTTRNGAGFSLGGYDSGNGGGTSGFGGQPFMGGIDLIHMLDTSIALKTVDPANSAKAFGYARGIAYWLKSSGYANPSAGNTGGMHYLVDFMGCALPGQLQTSVCVFGNTSASNTRTDAGEVVEGLGRYYELSHDPVIRDFTDLLFAQMWCKDSLAPLCSVLGDTFYISQIEPGGDFYGPQVANGKWLGFFFGYDNGAAWPARRLHGFVTSKIYW